MVQYERTVGLVTRNLKQALSMIESKFCYMRWEGLVLLLDLVEMALRDTQKICGYLGPLMAKYKTQQRIFGLIIDGSQNDKITPITSKETSIALEILQKAQRLYSVNPHSKGFSALIRLVVETALPQVQIPALRLIMALIARDACLKSFRKSGGVESLGKWAKEQRGAAKVINARPTLDVLELGGRLVALLAEGEAVRSTLEGILGVRELAEMVDSANASAAIAK